MSLLNECNYIYDGGKVVLNNQHIAKFYVQFVKEKRGEKLQSFFLRSFRNFVDCLVYLRNKIARIKKQNK